MGLATHALPFYHYLDRKPWPFVRLTDASQEEALRVAYVPVVCKADLKYHRYEKDSYMRTGGNEAISPPSAFQPAWKPVKPFSVREQQVDDFRRVPESKAANGDDE
jgi:hypothetical protein